MTNHVSVVPPYFRNFQSHKEPAFKGPRLACRVEAHTELVLARRRQLGPPNLIRQKLARSSAHRFGSLLIPLIKLTRKIPDSDLNSDSDRTRQGFFFAHTSEVSNKWAKPESSDQSEKIALFRSPYFLGGCEILEFPLCRLFLELLLDLIQSPLCPQNHQNTFAGGGERSVMLSALPYLAISVKFD